MLYRQVWVVVALGAACLLVEGCGQGQSRKPTAGETSVPKLLEKLPNLKPLNVQSCIFAVETSTSRSAVPSPSDTRVEINGSALLSESGSRALKSGFQWKPVSRDRIPSSLAATVPSGELLVSEDLNDTFSSNPTCAHGYVVVLKNSNFDRVYFLASDKDHPIK